MNNQTINPKKELKVVKNPPLVVCLSGLDPTGGAGISADIEALKLTCCHPLPLISCQTNQNGDFFTILDRSNKNDLIEQLDAIFAEFNQYPIGVCKIGLIANQQNKSSYLLSEFILHLRKKNNKIKIVFDPILRPTSAKNDLNQETITATDLISEIKVNRPFNANDILTPNRAEFFALSGVDDINTSAELNFEDPLIQEALNGYQKISIHNILITSINQNKKQLEHWLVQFDSTKGHWQLQTFESKALKGEYHGSGCTLSACLAGFLAHGQDLRFAIENALSLTHLCLKYSSLKGIKQNYPNRLIALNLNNDLIDGIDDGINDGIDAIDFPL